MPIVIPLEIKGDGEFSSAMRGMHGAVSAFKQEFQDLKKAMRGGLPSGGGGGGGGTGGGGGRKPPGVRSGPAQDLARAVADFQKAQASGDAAKMFDADLDVRKAQNRFTRAQKYGQPKGMMDLVKDAFMTSRIGADGGLMPLVNRILPIISKLGPVGIAVSMVATAATALVKATSELARVFKEASMARYAAGTSYANSGAMESLGGAVGMSSGDIANVARQFSQVIAGGGYAAGVFRQFGIFDAPGPYGKVDKFESLRDAVKVLMTLPEKQAIRLARESGLEAFLPLRDADKDRVDALLNEQAKTLTPGAARASANFNVELARLQTTFKSLLPLLSPLVSAIADAAEKIRILLGPLRLLMAALDWVEGWITRLLRAAMKAIKLDFRGAVDELRGKSEKSAADAARDKNTEAINENTRELRAQREVIGAGPRAAGALPGGYRYDFINRQLDDLARTISPI